MFNKKSTHQSPKPQLLPSNTTCRGATKPRHHNYWACASEAGNYNKRSHHNEKPAQHNWRVDPAHCNREEPAQKWRPSTAKNKLKFKENSFWIYAIHHYYFLHEFCQHLSARMWPKEMALYHNGFAKSHIHLDIFSKCMAAKKTHSVAEIKIF